MQKLLLVIAIILVAAVAQAAEATLQCRLKAVGVKIDNLALTSDRSFTVSDADVNPTSASSATYADHLAYYRNMTIESWYSYANGGVLTYTCLGTVLPNGTPGATLTTTTVAAGVATTNWSGAVASPTLSAPKSWLTKMGIGGAQAIKCTAHLSGTPAAGDKLTAIVLVWGC